MSNSAGKEPVNGNAPKTEVKAPLWLRLIKEYWIFPAVVVIFALLFTFVLVNARIPSASMEKTIMTGDRVFGNRLSYKKSGPERFDIVIFRYPDAPSRLFVKRVIGLPGETVTITGGKVYINDSKEPLPDSFCPEKPLQLGDPVQVYQVPEGSYFVLGDNRNNSNDSRFWKNKYVTADAILAKAGLRYWPLTKIGFIKSTIDDDQSW